MVSLVDTNILVYRHDCREPEKQEMAWDFVVSLLEQRQVWLPHQVLIEFVASTTRPAGPGLPPLLTMDEARREADELLNQVPILYPDDQLVRLALRGWGMYQLSWFDAHLWAYAERFGVGRIYTEDFQHRRRYGAVVTLNPFLLDPAEPETG